MRVFVAGASGVIGRPLMRQLLAAGHEVTGMTRRPERAERIRAAGAAAVVCDVFDAEALREAVAAAAPEAVVHMLTALPRRYDPKSDYLAATNRIRVEGTRNLVAAARAAGARRLVGESIAFAYRPQGVGRRARRSRCSRRHRAGSASPSRRSPSSSTRCSAPRESRESSCATAGSTAPAPTTTAASSRPGR